MKGRITYKGSGKHNLKELEIICSKLAEQSRNIPEIHETLRDAIALFGSLAVETDRLEEIKLMMDRLRNAIGLLNQVNEY